MNIFTEISFLLSLNKAFTKAKGMSMQNWKTTVAGLVTGGLLAWANYSGPNTRQGYISAIGLAVIGILAKDFDVQLNANELSAIKSLLGKIPVVVLMLLLAGSLSAQTPAAPTPTQNFYAAGVSYNNGASPSVAGTGLYAHLLPTGTNTYAFTVADILPTSYKPFTVTSNFGVGVAQKLFSVGKVDLYVPTSAGISFTGTNTGWSWTTGVIAPVTVKGNWGIAPAVRLIKSNVPGGQGYQPIGTVLLTYKF
jgi:hypothetical protein